MSFERREETVRKLTKFDDNIEFMSDDGSVDIEVSKIIDKRMQTAQQPEVRHVETTKPIANRLPREGGDKVNPMPLTSSSLPHVEHPRPNPQWRMPASLAYVDQPRAEMTTNLVNSLPSTSGRPTYLSMADGAFDGRATSTSVGRDYARPDLHPGLAAMATVDWMQPRSRPDYPYVSWIPPAPTYAPSAFYDNSDNRVGFDPRRPSDAYFPRWPAVTESMRISSCLGAQHFGFGRDIEVPRSALLKPTLPVRIETTGDWALPATCSGGTIKEPESIVVTAKVHEVIRLGLVAIWVTVLKDRDGRKLEGQELACNTGLILMIHFYYYM